LSASGVDVKNDPSDDPSGKGTAMGHATTTATTTTTATPLLKEGGVPESKSSIPPSPFCKRHEQSEGTDLACRGCKLAAERFDAYAASLDEPVVPKRHEHRWLADGTCNTCEARKDTDDRR